MARALADGHTLRKGFAFPGDGGGFVELNYQEAKNYLAAEYELSRKSDRDLPGGLSPSDSVLHTLRKRKPLDYVGKVAGYQPGIYEVGGTRFLVTEGFTMDEGEKGDWSIHREFLEKFCGRDAGEEHWERQFNALMLWMKQGRRQFRNPDEQCPSPFLAVVGASNTGKTWWQTNILPKVFTGRLNDQKANNLLNNFNGDMVSAELVIFSDATGNQDYKSRDRIADELRALVANPVRVIEQKGKERVTLPPKQVLVASANLTGIAVLPPVKAGIADKLLYVQVHKVGLWDGVDDPKKDQVMQDLNDQLPAFLYAIDNWDAPDGWGDGRFGVKAWQHPELVDETDAGKPSDILVDYITTLLGKPEFAGKGTAWLSGKDLYHTISLEAGLDTFERAYSQRSFLSQLGYLKKELDANGACVDEVCPNMGHTQGVRIRISKRKSGDQRLWRIESAYA